MSAELPYLPPLERLRTNVAGVATDTAAQVRAQQSVAARAGTAVRGAAAMIPAAAIDANNVLSAPGRAAADQVGEFGRALFALSPTAPAATAGLPTLAAAAAPATQQPVVAGTPASPGTLTSSRDGNNVTITDSYSPPGLVSGRVGNHVAVVGFAPSPPVVPPANRPMAEFIPGTSAASTLAKLSPDEQRMHMLGVKAASYMASLGADPHAQAAAYTAAMQALPTLAGVKERGEAAAAETRQKSEALRHNVQFFPIGEEVNPAGPAFPPLKKYGYAVPGKNGAIQVYDIQGNLQKPPEAPKVMVGAKVKQKDGSYPIDSGKTVVVKGGVITEIR